MRNSNEIIEMFDNLKLGITKLLIKRVHEAKTDDVIISNPKIKNIPPRAFFNNS